MADEPAHLAYEPPSCHQPKRPTPRPAATPTHEAGLENGKDETAVIKARVAETAVSQAASKSASKVANKAKQ